MTTNDAAATSTPMLRRLNATAVLDVMRTSGAVTGTDLMRATGLSRATVHAVCDDLIRTGWVRELESLRPSGDARTGRPSRRYEYNSRAGYVLGLDMGAFKTTALLADLRGETKAKVALRFRDSRVSATERLRDVDRAVQSALDAAGVSPSQVLTVGLGVPGPVDADGHVVVIEEYRPDLARTDFRAAIGRQHGWRVLVENDANLAVLAERWRGIATGIDNVIVMLAGERLGSGLFVDGRLLHGRSGGAGEMAFVDMENKVGGATGIAWQARRLGEAALAEVAARPDSANERSGRLLRRLVASGPGQVEAEMVFDAARGGDALALDVIDRVAVSMAQAIAVMAILLNPELVVIGGAVAQSSDLILQRIGNRLGQLTRTPPRLAASALGDEAVVLGAVRLGLDFVESQALHTLVPARIPESRPAGG